MTKAPFPHKSTLGADAALARLRAHGAACIIVASSQYSPDPTQAERTLFFAQDGSRLSTILDAWLAPEVREDVVRGLRTQAKVTTGSCSATYTSRPEVVWADCGDELRLWRNGMQTACFGPRMTKVRYLSLGPWVNYSNSRFSRTHGFVSPSWVRRGVRLHGEGTRALPVAQLLDPITLFDPSYDAADLMVDTRWVRNLAEAISDVTTIPLYLDTPLA